MNNVKRYTFVVKIYKFKMKEPQIIKANPITQCNQKNTNILEENI